VTIPPTIPLPATEARARTLTTKIHTDQEGTAQARREESRIGAKQPKSGQKKHTAKSARFFFLLLQQLQSVSTAAAHHPVRWRSRQIQSVGYVHRRFRMSIVTRALPLRPQT